MNPNQTTQNLKRKFSLIAQKNSVPYSDENGNFDQSWVDKFSNGVSKKITLLSITIAPSGTFEAGSQYYNSTDKLIYTAVNDDTWTGATTSTPEFGIIYVYDNSGTTEYYVWDGDNLIETDLEKYQLKSNITDSYTSSSTVTYPSSKALKDGLDSIDLSVYKLKAQTITIDSATVDGNDGLAIQANKNYIFSNANITSIKFASCEQSMEETTIQFTTGNSAPTLTDNSGLVWFGGIPTLLPNTTYVIVIFNKQAFYQEN